jgi:hypothetical protein
MARWVFSTLSAIAVALAGSIAALVYYSRSRVPGAPTFLGELIAKVGRARRAYYARKRRPLKVEVMGPERVIYRDGKEPPTVVEKEVVRFIDQIVLIPRWGIKNPIHINAHLFRRNGRNRGDHPKGGASADALSNVMPLGRKNEQKRGYWLPTSCYNKVDEVCDLFVDSTCHFHSTRCGNDFGPAPDCRR